MIRWTAVGEKILTVEPNDITGCNGLMVGKAIKTTRRESGTFRTIQGWEKNAKLMAAAPELYQVLEDLVLNIHMSAKTLQPHVERAHQLLRSL